jgi:segregation and condensation protein B
LQPHELSPLIEALLFVSDQPLTVAALVKAVDDDNVGSAEVKQVLEGLIQNYDTQPRGFKLVRLGNGYQVLTRERYAPWVKGMLSGRQRLRLSRAALETGAVIAYKQPITRMGIERVRGVDVGGVLNTLLERGLVMIKGRDPGPGRPLLYGTTQAFLEYFGLSKLSDLPRMEEIAALAQAEGSADWDEREQARFERHGVEAASVPFPGSEEEVPPAEEVVEAVGTEAMQEDRETFQEVVSDLAETIEPEDPEVEERPAAPGS